MTEFAEAAARLAGAAWGWRPHEFWVATPAELGAIVRAAAGHGDAIGDEDVAALKRLIDAEGD